MEEGLPLAFPVAEDGTEDKETRPVRELQNLVDNMVE
jgi:hypothetical protein